MLEEALMVVGIDLAPKDEHGQRSRRGPRRQGVEFFNAKREQRMFTVKTFLNRLLGLTVAVQNRFFRHFTAIFEDEIAKDRAENKFDDGVVDMAANSGIVVKSATPFYTDQTTKARSTLYTLDLDRGMDWNAALAELQAANAREAADGNTTHINGFYEEVTTRFVHNPRKYQFLAVRKQNQAPNALANIKYELYRIVQWADRTHAKPIALDPRHCRPC